MARSQFMKRYRVVISREWWRRVSEHLVIQQVFRHTTGCEFSSRAETEIRLEGSDPGTRGLGKLSHGTAWPTSLGLTKMFSGRGDEARRGDSGQDRTGQDKTEHTV